MRVFTGWRDLPPEGRGAAVALGNFDGVHRGHAHVLDRLRAAAPGLPLAVLTFEPHPRAVFRPQEPPFRLTLAPERERALASHGVDLLYVLPFDQVFAAMPAATFAGDVLAGGLGARHLACGPDFSYGAGRAGDTASLIADGAARGIGVTAVSPLLDDAAAVSSSRVRAALRAGEPAEAARLLGRPWAVRGKVTEGDRRGRTLAFPTANIPLGDHLEPLRGVYAVTIRLPDGREMPGVANIGIRPTVGGTESRVEAHLFDFSDDLYGADVAVALRAFLRPEQRFAGLAELRSAIASDAQAARRLLES